MRPPDVPRLAEQMARLLAGGAIPSKTFIEHQTSFQAVYDLAYGLKGALAADDDPAQPVCLYTEDKVLTAAAMLAGAAEDTPPFLLPYALNPGVLREIHATTGACRVVTDRPGDLPPPLRTVTVAPAGLPSTGLAAASPDKVIASLFTGGTTGSPQIWPKTIGNLFGEAFFMAEAFAVSADDRFVATTVPYHIYGLLFAVLVPLVAGAGIAPGIPSYPHDIGAAIRRHRATVLAAVPMHYRVLHGTPVAGTHLRLALSSAGRLDPEDGRAFFARTGIGVTEIYGSTETGGIATRNRAWGESALTPLASVATRIAGERLDVRSPYLSPSLPTDAEGFYRTGDRVREEAEGRFVLLGRADGIVKVGGNRVDLEGVQACLQALPGVSDALVLALPAGRGRENEIVALVEGGADVAEIRQALAAQVEPYALPRRILKVDRIPMSAAGKYDRQAAAALFARDDG